MASLLIDALLVLICMLFNSIWIIVVHMFVSDFTGSVFFLLSWNDHYLMSSSLTMYVFEIFINIFYYSHWLSLHLLRFVSYFFSFDFFSVYAIGLFTRRYLSIYYFYDHDHISSSLMYSLLTWICMLFHFILIIVADTCLVVLREVSFLCLSDQKSMKKCNIKILQNQ